MSNEHPVVAAAALAEIYAHARKEYPKECCGIIFGPKENAEANRAQICRNIQDDLHAEDPVQFSRDAHTAYNFDAGDIFKLQKSLRGNEPAKLIYHSHANVGAYFSDTDQAAAKMGDEPAHPVEYLVVDVQADGVRGSVQFAWDDAQKLYVEVRRYGSV